LRARRRREDHEPDDRKPRRASHATSLLLRFGRGGDDRAGARQASMASPSRRGWTRGAGHGTRITPLTRILAARSRRTRMAVGKVTVIALILAMVGRTQRGNEVILNIS